ncbi:MAG: glycosyltransferase family 2 protein [Candidatus Vecturithrix sp.]|jgi:glycosyltransferase involved in cell wall biosynthesis|nr:glycosyltransferase family 2 protein [Candidatus Vecturithrix sp.]
MELSIVSPIYNEEANIEGTVQEIRRVLVDYDKSWELILVNDGSTDKTLDVAQRLTEQHDNVSVYSYPVNRGQGYALRTGLARAKGRFLITIESDLRWNTEVMLDMLKQFEEDRAIDIVLASPYMPGGYIEHVSWKRRTLNQLENKILGLAMPQKFSMVTQMFRAYRREVLDSLELEADNNAIHLEILSKALAAGFRAVEVPAVLKWRATHVSTYRFRATSISRLLFSFYERPALLFTFSGILLGGIGLIIGVYILLFCQQYPLNPIRSLMGLLLIVVFVGIQLAAVGFISTQIAALKKELIKIQRENRLLEKFVRGQQKDSNFRS